MCEYLGVFNKSFPNIPAMPVENIPSDCEIIIYTVAVEKVGYPITSNLG